MKKIKRTFDNLTRRISDKITGSGLMQEENTASGERYITPGMPELIRACGAEGIVLLKNEGRVLPLKEYDNVAVFGRCQNDWFYVGYGSGGDVHPPYKVSLMEGLGNAGIVCDRELAETYRTWCEHPDNMANHGWWGHWPYYHEEMPLEPELVKRAAERSRVALVVIGRAAGEDRENVLKEGSYYLTAAEREMLRQVSDAFDKVVLLLNCGSIMDMSFLEEYPVTAVLYVWQLGQESGNAVADVLSGRVNPSGKLTDTIAKSYRDYPSSTCFGNRAYNNYEEDIFVGYRYFDTFDKEVLYPFGFGLSYTRFLLETVSLEQEEDQVRLLVRVTNTGNVAGKEVIQVYCAPPEGRLDKPAKVLVAYAKTKTLLPGETVALELTVQEYDCASFDDSGVTGYKDAFVLEAGTYRLLVGNTSRMMPETGNAYENACLHEAGSFRVAETKLVRQCQEVCIPDPAKPFDLLGRKGRRPLAMGTRKLRERIRENLPEEIPYTGDQGIKLADVAAGKQTLEAFVAQLSDKELGDLTHGEGGMGSAQGTVGNAGVFGGYTPELKAKGVPVLTTADGPSGLRLKKYTSLLPIGTAIACTWNEALAEELFEKIGQEAGYFAVDVILSPGMNIHRNPLCGRNFEYYSEDPLLTGKTAAAAVRGIQRGGASACPKHFACNNQEINRNYNDSRVSMRALREIYLKGFEICVKEAKPQNLMTSYNKINGVWSHYNYDLVTTVLRGEWDYRGNVVTDWWMRKAGSPEFPKIRNNAYRVQAQVDVLMPGNLSPVKKGYIFDKDQLKTLGQPDGLTRGELQRSAMNVLQFAMKRMQVK